MCDFELVIFEREVCSTYGAHTTSQKHLTKLRAGPCKATLVVNICFVDCNQVRDTEVTERSSRRRKLKSVALKKNN